MAFKKEENKQTGVAKHHRLRNYRKRQRGASIYFLLWSVFSVLSLFIVLLISFSQRIVMIRTYKETAANEAYLAGQSIQKAVENPLPEEFRGSWSAYLNFLSAHHGVNACILREDGEMVFPRNPDLSEGGAQEKFPQVVIAIQKEIGTKSYALFEGDKEYIYGAKIVMFGGADLYLYVSQPLDLLDSALNRMGVRTTLLIVFTFFLAFAVSSAVAGWLIKPISEMKDKARLLAKGDFAVDFHGRDYGKELVELADSLNFARDELSKTDTMQKELIANVSHDFKTPLTMIKAYAAMIQEISGNIPEKRDKHAQVIVDEADRLTALVNDVLDLSKLQSGMTELKQERVDISAYLLEILDRFAYLQETQGYQFETEVDEELYAFVDELKIGQALYNLIGNAVNYTGEDKKVFVSLKKTGENTFRFSVRDTGKGIKKEDMPNIWERYYRSSEMHKRPVRGTGLGLSIVKIVLEKHDLHFGVESEENKGSLFFVDFINA